MRWLKWLFVVLLVVVAVPKHVSAQDDVITGTVTGPDKKPVIGARVEAVSIESEIVRSGVTNAKGQYFILFPDGGGRYILRITYLGMADLVKTIQRSGDEEMLLNNYTMAEGAVNLGTITGTTTRAVNEQNAGKTGEQTTDRSSADLQRLPLPDLDPATIALLVAGVTGTGADSVSGKLGFSVAGMSDLLNQVVIDGVVQGANGGGVPEEGVRRTSVTTSTFDASKGGFAGGQVTQSTARGNNRKAGSFSYKLDADALQVNAGATTNAFTTNNFGGSWGGPIKNNKLFYNTSFQLIHNVKHQFALEANDPLAAIRAGVAVDSINRFVDIVGDKFSAPVIGQTGPYNNLSDNIRLQSRIDWNINQSRTNSQTVSLRGNYNKTQQDSTRISTLDIADHGGESDQNGFSLGGTLSSRVTNFTNNVNMSYSENKNSALGYSELPEGRVRVTSQFDDGSNQTSTLSFGGNRAFPTDAYSRDLQLTDDLSFLQHVGLSVHRLKVGGNLQNTRSIDRTANNIFGSYTFNSLADFEANTPASFTRSLSERKSATGQYNAGLYVGDTWRVSEPLELTLGLRYDYTALDQKPARNEAIETIFNRRTDISPVATAISPRVGFNLRIGGSATNFNTQAKNISGGIGLFAGRAPTNIYSAALRQTGLPTAEQTLNCIGDAVPLPDWTLFADDPSSIPSACADGGIGSSPTQSFRAPDVTLIDPAQKMPSSLRFNLGYRTQLPKNLQANFGYSYSLGIGLWGYRDLNLNESNPTILGNEGREFFGNPDDVVPETGAVLFASSRLHPEYGGVYDVESHLKSTSHQLTGTVQGFAFNRKLTITSNYTLGFSRDQGSGSFAQATTAADPNVTEWANASNDTRHTLNLQAAWAFTPEFEFSINGRMSSGTPFTPIVNQDVNGDGARNDRAYVFNPTAIADTAVSNGMTRLLANSNGRIASCIEAQLGTIADRNSCRNGWGESLSFQASIRPNLPTVQRRMTIQIQGSNVLTGLDQLINGGDNLHGWGTTPRADANLLEVRGFNPVTRSFIYTVNEGFGKTNRGPNALHAPFAFTINARIQVGGQPNQTNRGFGQTGGFGGGGGGRGQGGPGGFGGGPGGGGQRGGGGDFGGLNIGALTQAGANVNIDSIVGLQFPNPIRAIMSLKDSLKLTQENIDALRPISDSLQAKIDAHIAKVKPAAEEIMGQAIASRAQGSSAAANQNSQQQMQQQLTTVIQPEVNNSRAETNVALTAASTAVGPTIWAKVPANLKATAAPGGGGRNGGFNAVGLLDRMVVNPIPVLLGMKDTLKLTPDQVTKIEAISGPLTDEMLKARTDIGKKFDNVPAAQMGAVFGQVQPQIDAARKLGQNALKEVQKILTPAQWKMLPDRVKDPYTNTQIPGAGGGGRGPGGGGRQGGGGL